MICEHINSCQFIQLVSEVMPITALVIKASYCKDSCYGCAKHMEHQVIAIDIENAGICPGTTVNELEIFEKKYSESYKELWVRHHRETQQINKFELAMVK